MKFMSVDKFVNYVDELPTFYSITKLDVYNDDNLYIFIQNLVQKFGNFKFTVFKNNNVDYDDNSRIIYYIILRFDLIPGKKRLGYGILIQGRLLYKIGTN